MGIGLQVGVGRAQAGRLVPWHNDIGQYSGRGKSNGAGRGSGPGPEQAAATSHKEGRESPTRGCSSAGEGKSRLVGDVAFDECVAFAGAITPVPGGVGPMTIANLLANTLRAAHARAGLPGPEGA